MTLAEALLALGLSVVIILVTIELAITALRSNQKGSDVSAANAWGGKLLENYVYSLPPSTDTFWSSNPAAIPTQTVQLGVSNFTGAIFLTDLSAVTSGTKLVTVNVTWGSGSAGQSGYGEQVVSLSRLIYGH